MSNHIHIYKLNNFNVRTGCGNAPVSLPRRVRYQGAMRLRPSLFSAFRRDRLAGFWLAALLLIVPFIQPLSEAHAAGKPFAAEICSAFGTQGKAVIPGLADDCAACIVGTHAPQLSAGPQGGAEAILPDLFAASLADLAIAPGHVPDGQRRRLMPPGQAPPSDI